ncbi:nitrous oxide reductase accessory protein NosL [Nitrospirillum sp. BR 11828]|uniref:nitrous oxide reductase accessory protein NosL n=1 Tax=Nitrospirillum sp. BR 11828 TaxID=3104325 RepID=UPI002ACAF67E|nr:nitrous oxide reductase accessory protein NosL [Nitrospirillum sp. BR 11828]MDZ5650081.1 nitrous oxide reductase accessory protein NosL [Nitrospirillum sp. BR 11828]
MRAPYLFAVLAILAVGGCKPKAEVAAIPAPHTLTDTDLAHFCNMAVTEHGGPKGQVLLKGDPMPVWFASVRDTVAYTLLPEEPKDIAAIYVTDMDKLNDQHHPPAGSWIDARAAFYVVGSGEHGAMGGVELFPFGTEAGARAFAQAHDGTVVRYADIRKDQVFEEDDRGPAGQETAGRTAGGAS